MRGEPRQANDPGGATDRVARDPLDLVYILNTVKAAGAGLRLLDEPFIDTTSEMSDLIMFIVGWADARLQNVPLSRCEDRVQ